MIAMRVFGLAIAFACFNACIGQLLGALNQFVSRLTAERSHGFVTALDVNGDGIVEMKEVCMISDCISEKLHLDEKDKKLFCEDYVSKAWDLLGFSKAESGHLFHENTVINLFAAGKYSPFFKASVRATFTLLYDILSYHTRNSTVGYVQFDAFHSCVQSDKSITPLAFEKADTDNDGGVSEDELCDCAYDFITGDNVNGKGSYFFGKIN